MQALGVDQQAIDEALDDGEEEPIEVFEVWRENRRSLEVFLALRGQWRLGVMGGFLGLDYTAIEFVMRMMGVKRKDQPALFGDLRAMEQAALAVLRQKAS